MKLLFQSCKLFAAKECSLVKRLTSAVVHDEDYERAIKKDTLQDCKTDCMNDEKCKAMYYSNGFCFIVYLDAPRIILYTGSEYYDKVCNHTYSKYRFHYHTMIPSHLRSKINSNENATSSPPPQ